MSASHRSPSGTAALRSLVLATALLGTAAASAAPSSSAGAATATPPEPDRTLSLRVEGGYHPSKLELVAGERTRLLVTRVDYGGCTRHIVFPTLDLKVELPTGTEVAIDLPALEPGSYPFHCGMKMVHGTLLVAASQG